MSILSHPSRQELRHLRTRERFYCPICKEEVKLKVGHKNTPHFAHWSMRKCEGGLERESEDHLLGKKQLFTALEKRYDAELEPYLSSIRQRPDFIVKTREGEYPIEFQCSSLSPQLLGKRTSMYKKEGYTPIWILGAKRYKRLSAYLHELSPFEWYFLRSPSSRAPFLLYYSSFDQHLIQLQHIYPFSPKMVFAVPARIPLPYVTLSHFFPRGTNPFTALFPIWTERKKKWRLSYMMYRNKQYDGFLRWLYENGIPPSHFPAEAGIPHSLLYMIETPACIWQTYVLLDLFSKRTIGMTAAWEEIAFSFSRRIRQKDIVARHFPISAVPNLYEPLRQYVDILCDVNILRKTEGDRYELVRGYTIPETASDAFMEDMKLLKMVKQMR
jgi:competence CoiA-like predicted nuclease